MKNLSIKTLFFSTLLLLVTLLLLLYVPFRTALVFYEENTASIEAFLPIKEEDTFQIVFKHSIHLTDVVEKYIVTANKDIKQYEIIYEEFGIGMPSNAEVDQEFEYIDGKYHIKDLNNVFSSINIRNGKTVSENRLFWGEQGNHMVYFNDYFEPGAWFRVEIKNLSLWQYLKGVRIHE
ncbi:DUF1850 domain-containing protein [Virgibacillus sp. C22-A2]|uniref:DUF1850 domain-containing protein n=1 Tax=Virgibacillus tibetensis TaxID=3042313 RepID=A0ABU6KHL2_9BACI|nr:DUF1850 domain-containing protein [Virgibacillus sp. C22-A2]